MTGVSPPTPDSILAACSWLSPEFVSAVADALVLITTALVVRHTRSTSQAVQSIWSAPGEISNEPPPSREPNG